MKSLLLLFAFLTVSSHVSAEAKNRFDFKGQASIEIKSLGFYNYDYRIVGSTCEEDEASCGYVDVPIRTCENQYPYNCITTTYSEYRCSSTAGRCTSGWTSSEKLASGTVTFVNPEFLKEELPFSQFEENDWFVLRPDYAIPGVLVAVKQPMRELRETRDQLPFVVSFHRPEEFHTKKIKKISKATFGEAGLSFIVTGELSRDEKFTFRLSGFHRREMGGYLTRDITGSLRELKARILPVGTGAFSVTFDTEGISFVKADKLELITHPQFPELWEIFGDKKLAEETFETKLSFSKD